MALNHHAGHVLIKASKDGILKQAVPDYEKLRIIMNYYDIPNK